MFTAENTRLIAFLLTSIVLVVGCRKAEIEEVVDNVTSDELAVLSISKRKSVGILGGGESKDAVFEIQNISSTELEFLLGPPSCNCSGVSISPSKVTPGSVGVVTVSMKNINSTGGRVATEIPIRTSDNSWVSSLKVDAIFAGVSFSKHQRQFRSDDEEIFFRGRVYSSQSLEPNSIEVAFIEGFRQSEIFSLKSVEQIDDSGPRSEFQSGEFVICLAVDTKRLQEKLNGTSNGMLFVSFPFHVKSSCFAHDASLGAIFTSD